MMARMELSVEMTPVMVVAVVARGLGGGMDPTTVLLSNQKESVMYVAT